jgi:hypothetical protein
MIASNAHGKAEHMDMLCELKVVNTAMRMLEKDGWKTIGDENLTVCSMILSSLWLPIYIFTTALAFS